MSNDALGLQWATNLNTWITNLNCSPRLHHQMALPRSSRRVTLAAAPVDFRAAQLNQLRKKQHLQPAAAPPTTPAQLLSSPHSDTPSSPPTPLEFFSLARYPIQKAPLHILPCPAVQAQHPRDRSRWSAHASATWNAVPRHVNGRIFCPPSIDVSWLCSLLLVSNPLWEPMSYRPKFQTCSSFTTSSQSFVDHWGCKSSSHWETELKPPEYVPSLSQKRVVKSHKNTVAGVEWNRQETRQIASASDWREKQQFQNILLHNRHATKINKHVISLERVNSTFVCSICQRSNVNLSKLLLQFHMLHNHPLIPSLIRS